jgi:hypothetical protein
VARIVKVILADLPHHPFHKHWKQLAERLAKELNVPLEVKSEDYLFAVEHGETDELGMASLPQLFVELEGGEIKLILSRFPFNPATMQADPEEAYRQAIRRIKEIMGEG